MSHTVKTPVNPVTQTAVLELQNVTYEVPSSASDNGLLHIISGADLCVQPQEKLAIVGRSGSGKSTLLALMAGLESATSGDVKLLGHSLSSLSEDARARLRALQIGFVFQNFQLMPSMTALENILMPLELFNVPNARQKALDVIEKVGLSHRASHRPTSLSGGEQQRVAIARALVTEPKILFADEPTGSLDEETANSIQQLLFRLNDDMQTTLILVTHDLTFAQRCDREVHLLHGKLVEQPRHNSLDQPPSEAE